MREKWAYSQLLQMRLFAHLLDLYVLVSLQSHAHARVQDCNYGDANKIIKNEQKVGYCMAFLVCI